VGIKIPPAVIGVAATSLADYYTHANLNSLFYAAGFPGDPKEGANKVDKCLDWMRRANAECDNPLAAFGELIAEFMEAEQRPTTWWTGEVETHDDHRDPLKRALAKSGLSYATGGRIIGASVAAPTLSLGERLSRGGLEALEVEYRRAYETIESDPPAAITAACAILESLCKTYLEREGIPLPSKATMSPLWNITAKHLGLSPNMLEDDDLKKILSGCFSIVEGIGALRTHAGSAHGRSSEQSKTYRVLPRHARLAVHSAHTLASFVLETWESKSV
jgi:hypothetical protein